MRKFILLMILLSPFLICDPQTNVTHYVITWLGGETKVVEAYDLGDGTVMLRHDLAGVAQGTHSIEVKARNQWGDSDAVPFDFTKELPGALVNIRIE